MDQSDPAVRDARHSVLLAASTSPQLCAHLLGAGLLATLVESEQAARQDPGDLRATADILLAALKRLHSEGQERCSSTAAAAAALAAARRRQIALISGL
ncbi:hypothetical protein ABPG75_002765 [Micractinium tetrahymenae]